MRCLDTRPRIRQKKDSENGTTWEKTKRKTDAAMDGLCQPRHDRHMRAFVTTKDEGHDKTVWRRIMSVAATPHLSGGV